MGDLMERDANVPDWVKEFSGPTGLEGMTSEELAIPFLRIAQNSSKARNKNSPEYIAGLEEGSFYSSIARIPYGASVDVVVVGRARSFTEWQGEGSGAQFVHSYTPSEKAGIEHRISTDEKGRLTLDNGNRLQDTRNFFVILVDRPQDGVMLYAATGKSIGGARTWSTMLSNKTVYGKKLPLYSTVWRISSAYDSNKEGTFYKLSGVEERGFIPENIRPFAASMFEQFSSFVPVSHDVE